MTKRELVFAAFDNKETQRVPVGFWFHFAPDDLHNDSPDVIRKNLEGHLNFYREFQPDFVKLMSDGYFTYPNPEIASVRTAADLKKIRGGYGEEWIRRQAVIRQGGADGIYLSVQNLQDSKLTGEEYLKYIAPSETKVLEAANKFSENNILHICGYKGARNDLKIYAGYPAKGLRLFPRTTRSTRSWKTIIRTTRTIR